MPLPDYAAPLVLTPDEGIRKSRKIPKRIWMFWHEPLADAPDVVQRCVASWRHLNPDHEVELLTPDRLREITGIDFDAFFSQVDLDIGWTHRTDLVRIYLLARFGGIWADATALCTRPLKTWLHEEARQTGFFTFRQRFVKDRILVTWFLASCPKHPLMLDFLDRYLAFCTTPRTAPLRVVKKTLTSPRGQFDLPGLKALERVATRGKVPYFWAHILFNDVIRHNLRHWTQVERLVNAHAQTAAPLESAREAYVIKLTYKRDYGNSDAYRQRLALVFDGDRIRPDLLQTPLTPLMPPPPPHSRENA